MRDVGARWEDGRLWGPLSPFVIVGLFYGLHQVVPLRTEHFLAATAFLVLAWSAWGRQLSIVAAPVTFVGFGYELFRLALPLRREVLTAELWNLEHTLFPVVGTSMSLSDLLASFSWPPLDLLTGATYLTHLPEVFGLCFWFFVRGDALRAKRLALGFLAVNVAGWGMWLVWPAAPPWYVDQYGLGPADLEASASAAGAARFDVLVGSPVFEGFYARSTNVFGAFPSLHAAYAVLAASAAWSFSAVIRRFAVGYAVVMCFAAMYLRHHYAVDVVAGAVLALAADRLVRWLLAPKSAEAPPVLASEGLT